MTDLTIRASDLAATSKLGAQIASLIDGPISIGLVGTLGAGKTYLAKAIISALGVDVDSITSPTFTICQEHSGRDWSISHVDLYRVVDEDELFELGIEQWVEGDCISIIEWADRFPIVAEGCDLLIGITVISETEREFHIRSSNVNGRILAFVESAFRLPDEF